MFRMISMISFLVVLGGLGLHHLIFPCGYVSRFAIGSLLRKKVHLFTLLFLEQKLGWIGRFRKLVFLLALLSFLVLLLTGFGPVLGGSKLQGYLLMIHATFAPVFIACTAVIALLGAGRYVFNKKDAENIPGPICKKPATTKGCWLTDTGVGVKAGFWFLLAMSLPVTLTIVLSMLPWFGTEWQELMFHAHRWSALGFTLVAIIELYMLARMQILEDIHGRSE